MKYTASAQKMTFSGNAGAHEIGEGIAARRIAGEECSHVRFENIHHPIHALS